MWLVAPRAGAVTMMIVGYTEAEGPRPSGLTERRWCVRCETVVWISRETAQWLSACRDTPCWLVCLPCAMEGIV